MRRLAAIGFGLALVASAGVAPAAQSSGNIVFFGDSLTAGFGVGTERAFPALVEARIADEGRHFAVVNAGVSGETSAGGLRRIDWILRQPVRVLVLELGANDGLRGVDPAATEENLQGIIDRTRAVHPDAAIVIAGMRVPPNLGATYGTAFEAIFPRLARANDAHLIPFLLEGVGGVPELNQADGIHPTVKGHEIVAEVVWTTLQPLLAEIAGGQE